jgi:L-ascorbate metabolism protein UlaG (beta-lactamase superfamily)
MVIFLLVVAAAVAAIFITGGVFSGPRYTGPVSDHFDGKNFFTPNGRKAGTFSDVLKWMLNRDKTKWTEEGTPTYGAHPLGVEKENIRITFINHSTFLIQVDGVNILTDPIYSQRASPLRWAGPRRMRSPGIKFENLPRIDVVLISHNHYDHLDLPTIRTISGSHHPKFITPLGVSAYLTGQQIAGVSELDWWQNEEVKNGIIIQAVPAQHFSGRGLFDRDATLWCGFTIKTSKGLIYFAGDSGYNENIFKEIAEKTGSIKISILPIGAYKPYWFMSAVHTSPEDAVKAHIDLKSRNSIASHFGTFPLADEGHDDPPKDLLVALKKGLEAETFVALGQGEVKIFE